MKKKVFACLLCRQKKDCDGQTREDASADRRQTLVSRNTQLVLTGESIHHQATAITLRNQPTRSIDTFRNSEREGQSWTWAFNLAEIENKVNGLLGITCAISFVSSFIFHTTSRLDLHSQGEYVIHNGFLPLYDGGFT